MLELDITHMIEDSDRMYYLSGSRMEHGDNAGQITWDNSKDYAEEHPLLKDDQIETARDYFKEYGAWSDEERSQWSPIEVQALVIQSVAADIREMEHYSSILEWRRASKNGACSSNIFYARDENKQRRWYYSLSH
jgi:hypothetical protein